MGTNYYAVREENRCEHCGRADELERLHIGKSSSGWAFAVETYAELSIRTLADWKEQLLAPNVTIKDEYGKTLPLNELMDIILDRRGKSELDRQPLGYSDWAEFHQMNNSYRGSHGLLFSNAGINKGDTWECFNYEFS